MIHSKFLFYDALCSQEINFLESLEKVLTEISLLNTSNKSTNHKEHAETDDNASKERKEPITSHNIKINSNNEETFSNLDKLEILEINIINILINMLLNSSSKDNYINFHLFYFK